jgi:hypothetical protein
MISFIKAPPPLISKAGKKKPISEQLLDVSERKVVSFQLS